MSVYVVEWQSDNSGLSVSVHNNRALAGDYVRDNIGDGVNMRIFEGVELQVGVVDTDQ